MDPYYDNSPAAGRNTVAAFGPAEMGWNDSIETEGDGYVLLPEGDYIGRITRVDKGRHNGSAKIPPCNKATVAVRLETPDGPVTVYATFLLHKSMEWKLSQLFRGIGLKKPGERMRMDWSKVPGSRCRVHIRHRSYEKDGETRTVNDLDRIYDFNEADFPQDPAWLADAMEAADALDEVF